MRDFCFTKKRPNRYLLYIVLISVLLLYRSIKPPFEDKSRSEQHALQHMSNNIDYRQVALPAPFNNNNAASSNLKSDIVEFAYEEPAGGYLNFEGFNNAAPSNEGGDGGGARPRMLVPNIVHYVNLKQPVMSFALFLSIVSAWLHQQPDVIYLHCAPCNYTGKYWSELQRVDEGRLRARLRVHPLGQLRDTLFQQSPGWIQHKSDVVRLLVLMHYGGIYLDNDMLLLRSLDKHRSREMTVSWDSDADGIGNQVLIANAHARLLRAMYDGYRAHYDGSQWYYNGGYYPAAVLLGHRALAHAVRVQLGTHMLVHELYKRQWDAWRQLDAVHLLVNHRDYLDKESPIKTFDERNVIGYPFTFGTIARAILKQARAFSQNDYS